MRYYQCAGATIIEMTRQEFEDRINFRVRNNLTGRFFIETAQITYRIKLK